jgi:predicted O-methyltransferase YrrM
MYKITRNLQIKKYLEGLSEIIFSFHESIIGVKDIIKLRRKIPQIRNYKKLLNNFRIIIKPYHEQYVSNVSTADMTISLELSLFLIFLCKMIQPKSILDLGSGFSSVVFRLYAMNANPKPNIWSVDDSIEWLEKTRNFLTKCNLYDKSMIDWHLFTQQNCSAYDLILHDLGSINFRKETLQNVLKLVNSGGIIVLDDIHKKHYRDYVKQNLGPFNRKYYSLKFLTRDDLGRYAALLII